MNARVSSVVIIGGGPGGYEAALVGAALGAKVTLVERDGLGGAAVLTDCVPSKALVSTASQVTGVDAAERVGVRLEDAEGDHITDVRADLPTVNGVIMDLAQAQSHDIRERLVAVGVTVIDGMARLADAHTVVVEPSAGTGETPADPASGVEPDGRITLHADVVLLATGAQPRVMDTARPDGERILTWQQIYSLPELPERLVVIGSGVTGVELAQAYLGLGSEVVLVSSRDRVLPSEDADAATVIENVARERGMEVLSRSRMQSVERTESGVLVTLTDGRTVEGSHALLAVGSIPLTRGIGLEEAGVEVSESGHIQVDRVSRTSAPGVYAAGDCTGVLPLASVAAMQGRIAMMHALGDAVAPLRTELVSANVFTDPEIATVGVTQRAVDSGEVGDAESVMLPLATNPRAKMRGITDGFVKLFARKGVGTVLGGVVVSPGASELIFPVTLAVQNRLSVDQLAATFTVYPSLSGSVAEAARRLHAPD